MSERALEVMDEVELVVGYKTYLELIASVIRGKETYSTGMTREVDRVTAAIDNALNGRSCALISGGDPGVYAMAGLVLEILSRRGIECNTGAEESLELEVVPGIPALCAGAALLGAPLTHDFAAISLSDLLTPWDKIEKRLDAAAAADFVIVIYNPVSRKRNWQLGRAREIMLRHKAENTPVGIVRGAMRENQRIQTGFLKDLHILEVDMQSIVFVGNRSTYHWKNFMITPRGYSGKYAI